MSKNRKFPTWQKNFHSFIKANWFLVCKIIFFSAKASERYKRRKRAKENEQKMCMGIHWSLKLILLCCVQTLESPCLKLNMVICALFSEKKSIRNWVASRAIINSMIRVPLFAALIREWKINDCSSQFHPVLCVYNIYREGGICYSLPLMLKYFIP
jgi:hypothetical protein